MKEDRIILVVEDTDMCRATLEIALQSLPVPSRFVGSAEEALRELDSLPICALITDIHLPLMSGLELIGELRSRPQWQSVPILVTSGDSDPGTPRRALAAGANAFFAKPYSPAAVRHKLEQLIHAK